MIFHRSREIHGIGELKLVEGIHGADAAELDAPGEREVGFHEAGDGFRAGSTEAACGRLFRIERDAKDAGDLRPLDEVTMIGVSERVAAMERVELEVGRQCLSGSDRTAHG